jgi:hypothetical protein
MDSFQVHKPTLDDVFLAKTGEAFAEGDQGASAPFEDEALKPAEAPA